MVDDCAWPYLACSVLVYDQLPSVSNIQIEPIVVQVDRLDLVVEENSETSVCKSPTRYYKMLIINITL